MQKNGDITIKNNGSIIVKPENLDLFLQEVKSKRQDQKEKSKSKAAYTSLSPELAATRTKIENAKRKAKRMAESDTPSGGNSIPTLSRKLHVPQRNRHASHVEALNQTADHSAIVAK